MPRRKPLAEAPPIDHAAAADRALAEAERNADKALPLDELIDKRSKDLLSMAVEPKQLTDALKVVMEWWKMKHAPNPDEEYGSGFGKGGTMRG